MASAHAEANRRWRERNPDYFRERDASMSAEAREKRQQQKHEAYVRRKARDPGAFRARAAANARAYAAANRDRVNEQHRSLYAADPQRHRDYAKAYAERHPDVMKDKQYQRYYGIGLDEYWAMHKAQDGLCAICGQPETARIKGRLKALSVDHDHATGVVRALLCHRCNRAIGWFGEDPVLMDSAAEYVRSHRDA